MKNVKFQKLSIVLIFAIIFATSLGLSNVTPVNAAAASHLVISEVYGGGGNSGATLKNDFIELYNPTSSAVSLTGWSVQYAASTGSFGSYKTSLSGSVAAHGYYLIQEAAGGGGTTALPTPDATGTINMAATAGKVALAKSTTTITGPTDANVVDFVGFGTANQYEGSGAAPAPSNTKSVERKDNNGGTVEGQGNGWDTNNNSSDLVATSVIAPQNSSSAAEPSGGTPPPPTSGTLSIYHIDVGQADSELVVSPTGKSLLIDCGEEIYTSSAEANVVGPFVQSVLGSKNLDYVLNTHFHLDHIGYVNYGGLWNLVNVQGFTVGEFIHRDYNNYAGCSSGTMTNWETYLASADGIAKLHPVVAVDGTSQIDLGGGVVVTIVTHDGNGVIKAGNFSGDSAPPNENDYSVGVKIKYGKYDEWIGGDLDGQYYDSGLGYRYHDIELSAAKEIGDVDVLKVDHHGSDHSSNATFIGELNPRVSIISVGDGNTYGHPTQTVMNRLNAVSQVYMTERGETSTNIGNAKVVGTVTIKTDGTTYTVNGVNYTATDPVRTDADGDGYFSNVDPNDSNASIIPSPNGGYDSQYQP